MRLENFITKKFKREKWLLVCKTKSQKNIGQIIICIINCTLESQIVKPNQYITLKRDIESNFLIAKEKEKAVVHNQATIYKQNRIPTATNKMHNQ